MPARATRAETTAGRTGPRRDLDALVDAFERAVGASGLVERELKIAGFRVRLRAAGPALLDEFWPAVAHLVASTGDGASDLTVDLWDTASTDVERPEIPWLAEPDVDPRATHVSRADGLRIAYRASERELVALDDRANLAVVWVPDHAGISIHVRGAPFLVAWHWWMRSRGAHPVHGGAVGGADGGVLLVGRGGSGKSSTAVACLLDGMDYASDDYVMLPPTPEVRAASMYSTAKLDPVQAARFPELGPALVEGPPGEKVLAFMHEVRPEAVTAGFPVRAVLAPTVTGRRETTVRELRPAEALAKIAPSTLLQLPIPDPTAFGAMAEVVRRVPSFELELGSDLSTIAPAVRGVLGSV